MVLVFVKKVPKSKKNNKYCIRVLTKTTPPWKTRQIDYTRMREMARENYANVINKCKHRCIEDFFNHTLYTYSVSLYNKSLNVTVINCVD